MWTVVVGRVTLPGAAEESVGPAVDLVLAAQERGNRQRSQHSYILLLDIYMGGV
jgi:hypothetical protein